MATVTTIPAQVLPGKQAQLVFTATAGGNYVKVWCTAAPRGSKLRAELDKQQTERVLVVSESDISKRAEYTFDVGGAYVLQVEEFTKGAEAYGGRYRGDPDGFRTEARVDAANVTISVATLLTCELGVQPDTATLQLYVSGDDIIKTTIASHGFASPSIERPTSDKARAASDSANVAAFLAAIGGTAAATSVGALTSQVDTFIDQFNSHIDDSSAHANADSDNGITAGFKGPQTTKALVRSLAECSRRFLNHIQNIDPNATDPFPGSGDYHEDDGEPVSDWSALLLATGGNTASACQVLFADLVRCYSTHIANDDVHSSTGAWSLGSQPALTSLHRWFLAELAALDPTPPANEHPAKVTCVSRAGFKEA